MADAEHRSSSLAAAGRATVVLTGGAVLVQLIGFLRQVFLAAEVGISSSLDAVLIALAAPGALVAVLTVGIVTAIVPAYAQAKVERGDVVARGLVGTVMVWLGLAGLVLSVVLWLFAEPVVAITAPGLVEAGTAEEAAAYVRMLAPLALVSTLTAVLSAACQAERLFLWMTMATVASPFLALSVLVVFWDRLGIDGFAVGTLVGALGALAILGFATIVGRVYPLPHLRFPGSGLGELARHALPLTLSSLVLQLRDISDRFVATLVLPGGVSALRYGNSVVRLPFGAIRPAYRTAIYPTLVETNLDPSSAGLGSVTERVLRYGVVFFVPLAGLLIAVAPAIIALLYDRGRFTESDLALTAGVVAVSAPLVVTWTAQPTLISALNARRQGTVLLVGGILTTVNNIILNVALGFTLGLIGVAASTTIASFVTMLYMGNRLSRQEPTLSMSSVGAVAFKATLAILPSVFVFGLPTWSGFIGRTTGEQVVFLAVAGIAGLTSYYYIARRLGLVEAGQLVGFARNTLRQGYRRLGRILRRFS